MSDEIKLDNGTSAITREDAHTLVHRWARACLSSQDFEPKTEFHKLADGRADEEKAMLYGARAAVIHGLSVCSCGAEESQLEADVRNAALRYAKEQIEESRA